MKSIPLPIRFFLALAAVGFVLTALAQNFPTIGSPGGGGNTVGGLTNNDTRAIVFNGGSLTILGAALVISNTANGTTVIVLNTNSIQSFSTNAGSLILRDASSNMWFNAQGTNQSLLVTNSSGQVRIVNGTAATSGSMFPTNGVGSFARNGSSLLTSNVASGTWNFTNTLGQNVVCYLFSGTNTGIGINGTFIGSMTSTVFEVQLQPGEWLGDTNSGGVPKFNFKPL